MTSAFTGTDPTEDSPSTALNYDPFFANAYEQGLVAPLFSLVLDRGNVNSTLALGGLPPGAPTDNASYASTPLKIIELESDLPAAATNYSFHTIIPSGFVFSDAQRATFRTGRYANPFSSSSRKKVRSVEKRQTDTLATDFPMIVDSGPTFLYLPSELAEYVVDQYNPAGFYYYDLGINIVQCDATAPTFGVEIGGTSFYINAADLIQDCGLNEGYCCTGLQDGGQGRYILGDTFLKNVYAVFDIGAAQMSFAAHENY